MQDIPLEQITKRFQLLAESLQEAIFSQSGTDAVLKSCALRDIPANKIPFVGQLTNRVLLGYLRPESFAFEIQKETGIDALKATQVAHDIDAEIFSEVRLELKKLYPPTIQTPTVQAQGFAPRESKTGIQDLRFTIQEQKPAPRPYVVQIPERFRKQESRIRNQETKEESGIRNQELGMGAQDSRIRNQELGIKLASPQTQPEIQDSRFKIQETKEESGIRKQESRTEAGIRNQELGMGAQDSRIRNQELGIEQKTAAPTASPATPPQNIPPNEAKSYKLKANEAPKVKEAGVTMDPIVPLPTFIQSKFKASELGMAGQESGIRNQESGMVGQESRIRNQESGTKLAAPQTQAEIQDSSKNDALKNAFGKFTTSSTATGVAQEPVSPYRETIEEPKKPAEQKPAAKIQGKVIDLSKF